MRSTRLFVGALALAMAASVGVAAQQGARQADAVEVDSVLPDVSPVNVFANTDFQSGGTGLRNQKRGGIMVNGVTGGVVTAYLYWAVITNGAPTVQNRTMQLQRRWPVTKAKPVSMNAIGTTIGTTASPCWGGTTTTILKADVTAVVTGSGLYQVQPKTGTTTGGDPWASPVVFPLNEGASLVIIYSAPGTTSVFDAGLHTMFSGGLTYTLTLPAATTNVKIDLIGADGQMGASRVASIGTETTSINGVAVGHGSAWSTSLWNGSSANPLPQLWDNHGRQFGIAANSVLTVTHTAAGDCLIPIANIVHQ